MSQLRKHRAAPLSDADAARLRPSDKPGSVKMRAGGGSATLLLYGEIGYDVTALGVTQGLATAGSVDKLDIRISSIGGSVIEGWAIFNVLARHPAATKTVTVEGMAASMASIIAMVGTTIVMPDNSYMMIHNPTGVAAGDADDMRTFADLLDHMQAVAAKLYSDRSGQPVPVVQAMMSAETFMGAAEAVALGFADQVENPLQIAARLDLDRLPTLPARMRASLSASMSDAPKKEPKMTELVVDPLPTLPAQPTPPAPPADPAPANPATRQPNNPASPGYGPADAAAVARACQTAGFPQLTARLLEARASMKDVTADIDRAKGIADIAAKMRQPDMATPAIADGVGLETFRAMAFAAKAGADPKIDTSRPHVSEPTEQPKMLSSREINDRARKQHETAKH